MLSWQTTILSLSEKMTATMDYDPNETICQDCRLVELCLPYGLPKNELKQFETMVKSKPPILSDQYLYRQDDECRSLYVVKTGSFRSFISSTDGAEQTIGFYLPGELMGFDAFQHGRFTSSSVALETSKVCELPLSQLNELCRLIPSLQAQMLRVLGKEIVSDHNQILLLGHRTAKEKMAIFLLRLSHRYNALGFSKTEFNLTMKRQDIANFLGITNETVSRLLTELHQQGIITINRRNIKINNMNALKVLVEDCY